MRHNESKIQQQCVKWMRYQHADKICFAIPNGGKRNKVEASIMSGEGVLSGVADMFLMHANNEYHGLFIEMKTPDGKQTDMQRVFEANAMLNGYKYAVCRSLDEFMNVVNEYLKG